jgi:hypothetical protein
MTNWRKLLGLSALKINKTPDSEFDPHELQMGIEVEYEHGVNHDEAKSIAKDHLSEKRNYYSLLKRYVEAKMVRGNSGYLHCPGCGHQAPEEDFKNPVNMGDPLEFNEEQEEEESYVICPQCGRPFEREDGDPFGSDFSNGDIA